MSIKYSSSVKVDLVLHTAPPSSPDDYVHRLGHIFINFHYSEVTILGFTGQVEPAERDEMERPCCSTRLQRSANLVHSLRAEVTNVN